MYQIRIFFYSLLFFLVAFNVFAESPNVKTKTHVSGSGDGTGDGTGRSKRKEYVDPLTYEQRLANRGKGSGGYGLGRTGKPPKGIKKGGGELISILAPKETKDLMEILTSFYKKKYNVKFQIEYFSDSATVSFIENKENIDLLIADNSELIKKLKDTSRLKSELGYYGYRAVFVTSKAKSAKLDNLRSLCSGRYNNVTVLQESGNVISKILEKVLKNNKLWDKCKDKITIVRDSNKLGERLKSKQVDIAFTYYSPVKKNKNIRVAYELRDSKYPVPELPVLLLNADNGQPKQDAQDFFKFLDSHYADKFFKTFGYSSTWKKN